MKAVRIIVGILALLVALFSGGCSLFVAYDFVAEWMQRGAIYGTLGVLAIGLVICVFSSLLAYGLLHNVNRYDGDS